MRAELSIGGQSGLVRAIAVGAAYGLLAFVSLSMTRFGQPVESIWFSNAVLVWALVGARWPAWPLFFVCAAAGHVGAHFAVGDAVDFTLAFLAGDMSECLLCAWLLQFRPRALAFESWIDTSYFLCVCGLVGPFASAVVAFAASALALGHALPVHDFAIWFAADALGLIVFLPILQAVSKGRWAVLRGRWLRVACAVAVVALIAAISIFHTEIPPLRLLLLPAFVVIAFELGVAGVQLCLGALMLVWVGLTYHGRPMAVWGPMEMREYMLVVQTFLAIFAATILPLAVVLEQKQRLTNTLTETLKETREAWGAIIGAEARYRLVVDHVSETVMRVAPDGRILFASPACTELLHADRKFEGRTLFDLMHPDDHALAHERFQHCLDHGLVNLAQRGAWRIHGDDDRWYAIDARITLARVGGRGGEEFVVVLRPEAA